MQIESSYEKVLLTEQHSILTTNESQEEKVKIITKTFNRYFEIPSNPIST